MEVHTHTHTAPASGGTGRKKWTHYFWEFLMLFLAVFCGFLAEYQLEHKIENQREKQYMKSLIYDLENDTLNLNAGFPLKDQRINAIDSIFLFFEANPDVKNVPGSIVRFMRRSTWDRHYRRNSTTIDQLKNAGGLRLIRKKNIRDSIAAYDLAWQRAEFWREGYINLQERGKELNQKTITAQDLLKRYRTERDIYNQKQIDSLRFTIKGEHLNEYLNFISDQKITTGQDKRGYQAIEQSAESLIALIKKEYHLK